VRSILFVNNERSGGRDSEIEQFPNEGESVPKKEYAYAIVHDGTKFLLAKKNERGYFFWSQDGGGALCRDGKQLNGGGGSALPGGYKADKEAESTAAQREFEEETGIGSLQLSTLGIFPGSDVRANYYGVFFTPAAPLTEYIKSVNRHLRAGTAAAAMVHEGHYADYAAMRVAHPECPFDNELETVMCWDVVDDWEAIEKWKHDKDKSWFYYILEFMKRKLKPDL
jgi:8-oxo-dGTP pyrophosphatase MutT (NUDIX family)